MDDDLVKAILCLSEGETPGGDCLKIDLRNKKRYKNFWKSLECQNCPYMQTSYRIGGDVNSKEKNIWLKEAANIIRNACELKHFLEMEIKQAEERMKEESNPTFNGLIVGREFQLELNKGHIRFCKEVLKMLGK